jgi:hypothetical protein
MDRYRATVTTEAGADGGERLLTIMAALLQDFVRRLAAENVRGVKAQLVPQDLYVYTYMKQ